MSDKEQQKSTSVNSIPPETREIEPSDSGNLPLSQAETIERLQGTIGQLEGIVAQLRAKSVQNLLPQTAIETLVTSTQAIAGFLKQEENLTVTPVEEATEERITKPATVVAEKKLTEKAVPEKLSSQQKINTGSRKGIFGKIRDLLPNFVQEKLSNWMVIGVLAGVVLVLVVTTVFLLPKSTTQTEEIPSQLETAGFAQPVEIEPPPPPKLTPEQSLIAAIQEQVAEITSQYAEGIIMSIEANLIGSRLRVIVGDDWNSLDDSQQENLANEMFSNSQQLDFRKLEIQDEQGNLLARSPVVGQKMIILPRESN